MNILTMLKSCRGAVNKVALVATCGALGLAGLNMYNYVTTRPAQREARLQNLVSMMKSGHLPSEYAKIELAMGDTQFATAEEIAARERGIFGDVSAEENRIDNALPAGKIFGSGADGLMMNNRASFRTGEGAEIGGPDGASALASQAASAVNKDGKSANGADKNGAAGKNGTAGKNGFRASQISHSGGHDLGSGATGLGGSGSSAYGDLSQTGAGSISGAMAVGGELLAGVPDAAKSGRSARYINGRKDVRLGNGQGLTMEGLRGMTIFSGKVAASEYRSDTEAAKTFDEKEQRLAGKLEVDKDSSLGGVATPDFLDDATTNPNMPTLSNFEAALEEGFETEIDEVALEREELAAWIDGYMTTFLVATLCACFGIMALSKAGPGGIVAGAILTAAIVAMGVILAIKLNRYAEFCNFTDMADWDERMIQGSALIAGAAVACGLAWVAGTMWIQTLAPFLNTMFMGLATTGAGYAGKGIFQGAKSLKQDAEWDEAHPDAVQKGDK